MILRKLVKFALLSYAFFSPSLAVAAAVNKPAPNEQVNVDVDFLLPDISEMVGETQDTLPAGCENYELVEGNYKSSSAVILTELHDVCGRDALKCGRAIAVEKGAPALETSFMFELAAYDKHLSCEAQSLSGLSDDCRGLNRPAGEEKRLAMESQALENFYNELSETLNYMQLVEAKDQYHKNVGIIFKQYQKTYKEEIAIQDAKHKAEFKKFQLTHPDVSIRKFHSDHLVSAQSHRYLLRQVEAAKERFDEDQQISEILPGIKKIYDGLLEKAKELKKDTNRFIGKVNEYLVSSFLAAANRTKLAIGFVGHLHANKKFSGSNNEERAEAQKLGEELSKKLPVGKSHCVAACKLT